MADAREPHGRLPPGTALRRVALVHRPVPGACRRTSSTSSSRSSRAGRADAPARRYERDAEANAETVLRRRPSAPYSPPSGALRRRRAMDTAKATALYARATAGFDERVENARTACSRDAAATHPGRDRPGVEPRRRGPGRHRPDRPRSPADRGRHARHRHAPRRDAGADRRHPRALRHRDRALPAGARGGGHVRRPPRRGRDAEKRRAAQGVLRDAQGRAARPHARRPHGVGHGPAPRAVERARRGRVRVDRRRRPQQAQPARRLELGRRLALPRRERRPVQRACTTASFRASAARRARARSPSARTSAPAAGGGSRASRNAACTSPRTRARSERRHERADAARPAAPARARRRPARRARGRGDLHPARDRGRVRAAGAALFRRQGFVRRPPPRAEGVQARRQRRRRGCRFRSCTSTPATTSRR